MSRKGTKAILEIGVVVLVIALIYFLIGYLEKKDTLMDSEVSGRQVSVTEEVTDGGSRIRLGAGNYHLSHPVRTYLFIGTDNSGNEEEIGNEYRGAMADVLLLLVIDEEKKNYGILQINRDTITQVPIMLADGSANASAEMQICIAHAYGGDKKESCENTVNAVSDFLGGIIIDGYYALSMEAMSELNQSVGGVTVTFEEDLTELDPAMQEGATIKLTDEQAVRLMRARSEMKNDRNSERMARQNVFLEAYFKQVQQEQAKSTNFIIKLYDRLHPYATENININELAKLLEQMDSYTAKGIHTIEGETRIGDTFGDGEEHWEFYPDEASLESSLNALFPLVFEGDDVEDTEE